MDVFCAVDSHSNMQPNRSLKKMFPSVRHMPASAVTPLGALQAPCPANLVSYESHSDVTVLHEQYVVIGEIVMSLKSTPNIKTL